MFFAVNKTTNLECTTDIIGHDHGWSKHKTDQYIILYKGYCTNQNIHHKVKQGSLVPEQGCYIILIIDQRNIKLYRDINCNAPVFYTDNEFGNDHTIPNDKLLSIKQNITFDKKTNDIILSSCPYNENFVKTTTETMIPNSIPMSQAVADINHLLHQTVKNFFNHNSADTQLFLSGGLDSTTIASVIWKQKINVDVINYSSIVYDQHIKKNFQSWSNRYSALKEICYDPSTSIFVFGYNGDENFGRHPYYLNQIIPNLYDITKTRTLDYSYNFFFKQRPNHAELMKNTRSVPYNFAVASAINSVIHSYSTFHLAGNIHFNPLQDYRILQTILQMKPEDIIEQLMTGIINKKIIEMNCPELLDSISDFKNIDGMHNLKDKHYKLFKQ